MPSHVSEWRAVVVCEPDVAALESHCDRLRADGFHVLPASTAMDALRLCRRDKPDLMLLDMALPEASSAIVLRRIREAHAVADRLDPRLPIIALGERVDDGDRALEEGADDFLSKPL
jgi:DNA-binding response OmpR family regulator